MNRTRLYLSLLAALAFAGCNRNTETVDARNKPQPKAVDTQPANPHAGMTGMGGAGDPHAGMTGTGGMGGMGDAHAGMGQQPRGGIAYKLPQGWTEQQAGGMRYATIFVPAGDQKLELAVTNFPGNVGGNLANVNRWRLQMGAQPIEEKDLDKALSPVKTAGGTDAFVTDILAPDGANRMLAAIVPDQGRTWFFKLVGPANDVVKDKDAFVQLIQSISLGQPSTQP